MKQKTILKINKVQTRNTFGIVINKCCASCAHKDLTRAVTLRRCMKHRKDVRTNEVCKLWAMSQQLRMAGSTQGCVKRREYLMLAPRQTEEHRPHQGAVRAGAREHLCGPLRS